MVAFFFGTILLLLILIRYILSNIMKFFSQDEKKVNEFGFTNSNDFYKEIRIE